MSLAPPPQKLVGRFRQDLERLTEPGWERLGVAVSGGPDSLAMLLLANAAFPGRVEAATVDHGLRPDSATEAACVAALCARLDLPHATLNVTVRTSGEGAQGEARRARYQALEGWAVKQGLALLATAHHADDQAETLLMRLQRGSGLGGLAGIRAVRPLGEVTLVRPLLGWTREELAAVTRAAGVEAADDPSNRDSRYDRTRMRAFLARTPLFGAHPLARSAAALAQGEAALEWSANRLWEERVQTSGGTLRLDPRDIPSELIRRLLLRILAALAPEARPRGEEILRLADTIAAGGTATLAGVKAVGGEDWRFEPAPPRQGPG